MNILKLRFFSRNNHVEPSNTTQQPSNTGGHNSIEADEADGSVEHQMSSDSGRDSGSQNMRVFTIEEFLRIDGIKVLKSQSY